MTVPGSGGRFRLRASVDLYTHRCGDRWSGRMFIHNRCGPVLDKAVGNRVQARPGKHCERLVKKPPACPPPTQAG